MSYFTPFSNYSPFFVWLLLLFSIGFLFKVDGFKLDIDVAGPIGDQWGVGVVIQDKCGALMGNGGRCVEIPCIPDMDVAKAMGMRMEL